MHLEDLYVMPEFRGKMLHAESVKLAFACSLSAVTKIFLITKLKIFPPL